jgi:hypothetical protein
VFVDRVRTSAAEQRTLALQAYFASPAPGMAPLSLVRWRPLVVGWCDVAVCMLFGPALPRSLVWEALVLTIVGLAHDPALHLPTEPAVRNLWASLSVCVGVDIPLVISTVQLKAGWGRSAGRDG